MCIERPDCCVVAHVVIVECVHSGGGVPEPGQHGGAARPQPRPAESHSCLANQPINLHLSIIRGFKQNILHFLETKCRERERCVTYRQRDSTHKGFNLRP